MKIYPTNNSVSYKILKKINNYLFDCEPPQNICGYFWLSVFYGGVAILAALNLIVIIDTLLGILTGNHNYIMEYFPILLVVVGVVLALFLCCAAFVAFWALVVLIPTLLLFYVFNRDKVSHESFKGFLSSLIEISLDVTVNVIYDITVLVAEVKLPFKIKCKKLNFEEDV